MSVQPIVALPFKIVPFRHRLVYSVSFGVLCVALSLPSVGQSPSSPPQDSSSTSSSSSSEQPAPTQNTAKPTPHIPQVEASGSAVTLETNEPLFDIAVALNVCGYDTDLASSNPIRMRIRDEVNAALTTSAPARDSRDALCTYIRAHTLTDPGLNLAQYVSLALYIEPNPGLTASVDETEMPPDANQVINVLPLLRTFSEDVQLHALWIRHRPEYEALVNQVHDPLTRMILDTNVYLHLPVSSYDGRRFLVLLEPMLAPSAVNARIYANDYIVVTSPSGGERLQVHMDQIRHTYLHYEVEPLIYGSASSMVRLQPLLKPLQDSPLDFTHKTNLVAFLTECIIKAVEAHTMDVGIAKPTRPDTGHQRIDLEHYTEQLSAYERQAEATRRQAVDRDMRQGWALVEYFYGAIGQMERESTSLKEGMGEMVYGMDVDGLRHHEEQISFFPAGSRESMEGSDIVRRVPEKPAGLRLAEMKLMQGDAATAEELAQKALTDPAADHPQAHYVLAQADLMQREPDEAITHFSEALKTSKNPRTIAWSHIYLGRLYDIQSNRPKALEEYKAALSNRDSQPDTKTAAEAGIKQPFALPQREAMPHATSAPSADDDDNTPFDPSGKAEKNSYRPDAQPHP